MKRSKPLRRAAFRRRTEAKQVHAREQLEATAMATALAPIRPLVRGTYGGGTSGVPVRKEEALTHHQGYEDAVRGLGYCMLCGRSCRPQFCHADMGKGERIKTDVRRGWPGCGPGDWGPGCHWLVGTSGQFEKHERRVLEERLGRKTRAAVRAAGTWPARLAHWKEPE